MGRNLSLVAGARRGLARGLALISRRASALPSRDPGARSGAAIELTHASRFLRPLGWVALSALLGYWAWSTSSSESLSSWQKEHRPSSLLIRRVLQSRGFEEVRDPKRAQKLYRSLPATLGEAGEIWWSGNDQNGLVAWMENPLASEPFHLFCSTPCGSDSPSWKRLGTGWTALEAALPEIDRLEEKRKASSPAARKYAPYRDPRELKF